MRATVAASMCCTYLQSCAVPEAKHRTCLCLQVLRPGTQYKYIGTKLVKFRTGSYGALPDSGYSRLSPVTEADVQIWPQLQPDGKMTARHVRQSVKQNMCLMPGTDPANMVEVPCKLIFASCDRKSSSAHE